MTPLIQEMVAMRPDDFALEHHWFDMSAAYKREQAISSEILSRPLPFPNAALVCAYEDRKALLFVTRSGELTGVGGLQWDKKTIADIPGFFYLVDDEGVKVRHENGTPFDYRTSYATGVLAFIAAFLESLDTTPATGYMPIKRANWHKKIRQGKVPTYDWKTVVIEPSKPKGDDQGGTHASPRWHERRGHWRVMKKTGKKVWVKNCEVGDKARGAVFHDYVIGEKNDMALSPR
jgi:hypothetical protein